MGDKTYLSVITITCLIALGILFGLGFYFNFIHISNEKIGNKEKVEVKKEMHDEFNVQINPIKAINETPCEANFFRYIDKEAGVVCYVLEENGMKENGMNYGYSSMYCIPLSQTNLK